MSNEETMLFDKKGRIFQINRSRGGVPKTAIERCELGLLGLQGDTQSNKEVHGGPERALCLYSLDRTLKLETEGHSVFPGTLGENITISGLSWESVFPGVRLKTSRGVVIMVTAFTSPCTTINNYFKDRDSSRVSQKLNPGWSRVYAKVLEGGTVQIGDLIQVEN